MAVGVGLLRWLVVIFCCAAPVVFVFAVAVGLVAVALSPFAVVARVAATNTIAVATTVCCPALARVSQRW